MVGSRVGQTRARMQPMRSLLGARLLPASRLDAQLRRDHRRSRLFTYFGWAKPPRPVSWLYALLSGVLAAVGVLSVVRVSHMSLGAASRERLLYGVTLGPILEEVFFRGAAFSVIYVTASSVKSLARLRITLAIIGSSVLFALAHTNTVGIPLFLFFGTGILYAMMRWRSNSTATSALMHATYNAVIALAMLRA
jgi:membrane protease YdiL (CAAX protease family)